MAGKTALRRPKIALRNAVAASPTVRLGGRSRDNKRTFRCAPHHRSVQSGGLSHQSSANCVRLILRRACSKPDRTRSDELSWSLHEEPIQALEFSSTVGTTSDHHLSPHRQRPSMAAWHVRRRRRFVAQGSPRRRRSIPLLSGDLPHDAAYRSAIHCGITWIATYVCNSG